MTKKTKAQVIGVLNCTPDSFYDGDASPAELRIERGLEMIAEGADRLDIGGESSRPGAEKISVEEELNRVIPVISGLNKQNSCPISIDTCKAEVARAALDAGADCINDIQGCQDPDMLHLVAEKGCQVVLMHMQGRPKTMQNEPNYEDVVEEIRLFLLEQSQKLMDKGLHPKQIFWDPGIGFGKTLEHNLEIMRQLPKLLADGFPMWLGVSRKSFIAHLHPSADEPSKRLPGSLAVLAPAWNQGVTHFRVHDVEATRQFFSVLTSIQNS